jgi:hypothetical protein
MNTDPVKLFLKLQDKYKSYGAVKVTSADEWKSPFYFKYTDKAITTRIQKIHKLSKGKVSAFSYVAHCVTYFFSF